MNLFYQKIVILMRQILNIAKMKNRSLKSAFFASLILLSMTCFVYVNTAQIDRALSVETIARPTKLNEEKVEKASKMPDLALVKGILTIIQDFLPAK